MEVDGAGHILQATGGISLPMLLGDLGQFLVEPLPPDDRPAWEVSGVCNITESSGTGFAGRPFGPFGRPRGPFAAPHPGQARPGRERSTHTRGGAAGDTVTINKHYELKVEAGAGNSPALDLTGDGQITFDTREGLPRGVEFKAALKVGTGNAARRTPITVS